jgi:hypothetical protein
MFPLYVKGALALAAFHHVSRDVIGLGCVQQPFSARVRTHTHARTQRNAPSPHGSPYAFSSIPRSRRLPGLGPASSSSSRAPLADPGPGRPESASSILVAAERTGGGAVAVAATAWHRASSASGRTSAMDAAEPSHTRASRPSPASCAAAACCCCCCCCRCACSWAGCGWVPGGAATTAAGRATSSSSPHATSRVVRTPRPLPVCVCVCVVCWGRRTCAMHPHSCCLRSCSARAPWSPGATSLPASSRVPYLCVTATPIITTLTPPQLLRSCSARTSWSPRATSPRHTHTHKHTLLHTHTHAHAHTRTHTHTQAGT